MTARSAAKLVLAPAWRRLRWRIEAIAREAAQQAVDGQAPEVRAARDDVRDLRAHVDRLLGEVHAHQAEIDDRLRLMSAQLAAADTRVATLERPPVDPAADDAEQAEARRLIEEIRVEHGRARSRLAAIAFYEERIARLERDR